MPVVKARNQYSVCMGGAEDVVNVGYGTIYTYFY